MKTRFYLSAKYLLIAGALLISIGEIGEAQTGEISLELTSEIAKIVVDEPMNLAVVLRNRSATAFYVTGNINFVPASGWGTYELQYRRLGEKEFTSVPQAYRDETFVKLSQAETIARNNLFRLEAGAFIGRSMNDRWKDFFVVPPMGRLELRLKYLLSGDSINGYPLLTGTFISNILEIEIISR